MEGRWLWILAAIVGLVLLFLVRRAAGGGDDAEAAKRAVEDGAVLLDVRTPAEFAAGHIDGARNLPVQELAQRRAELPEVETPVVVYCRSGNRSARAKRTLEDWGYRNVLDLGPMSAWPR